MVSFSNPTPASGALATMAKPALAPARASSAVTLDMGGAVRAWCARNWKQGSRVAPPL